MNVLFVCLGNICRSPLAEAIFRKKVKDGKLSVGTIDSCGTGAWHIGENPDQRTIRVAQLNDVPIDHRGRQLSKSDFREFDHILVMDASNYHNTMAVRPDDSTATVSMMRDFDPEGKGDVPDPYWDDDGFQKVFDIIDRSLDRFIDERL